MCPLTPDSAMVKEGKKTAYTASVADEADLSSPVTVTGEGYTVTFDGNGFASKHLRRIRRNSVSELRGEDTGPNKLASYAKDARKRAVERWQGKESSTNSLIYLDLSQFCQFGCEVIKFLKSDAANPWAPYPPAAPNTMQKHATVTIGRCLAYSHSGVGAVRDGGDGRVDGGVGITLTVTVRQVQGNPKAVEVCHYAGGTVEGRFRDDKFDIRAEKAKMQGIASSIVT